jgi:predicted ATPase/DNA-binding SARP family transcriptional activator
VKISLLGPVEVRADDGTLVDLGGARLRTLLIRLALDPGRVVTNDALIDAVWEDQPPANAANALQQLVSRLRRRALPILGDAAGYRLDLPADDIDIFGPEAAGPGRGPALADVADRDFALPEITRLAELRLAAAEEGAQGISELEALAAAHPLRERPVELLMRALWEAGRPAEALAAFERYRGFVADELGADPSPALSRLHVEMLRGQGPQSAPQRLPVALTSFVGRDDDIARLRETLATARLVTLTGPGGSGKTRLALETARARPEARLIELAPLTDAAEVAPAILAALGVREHALLKQRGSGVDLIDPVERVVAALSHQPALLIMDNCEHLLDPVARITETVLTTCPGARVLATSREPLGLIGETVWAVEPLADAAAVRLLVDRASASRPGFRLDDPALGTRLCRELDGMPLAIELAAARLRTMPLEQLAARLDERFRLLTGGSRTALPRHQTLRAVVDWSWELCGEAERRVWTVLAVFQGGATLPAVEALFGPDAFEALTALADKSLVRVDGERYSMLETIREYGLSKLDAAERDQLHHAHAAYFADFAEEAEPHLRREGQLRWLRTMRADHENLHAALRRSTAAGDIPTAVRLVAALGWYWWLSGYRAEGSALAAEVLNAPYAGTLPAQRHAVALTVAAVNIVDGRQDLDQAKAWFERAAELLRHMDEPEHPVLKLVAPTTLIPAWDLMAAADLLPEYEKLFDDPEPWIAATARAFHAHTQVNLGRSVGEAKRTFQAALEIYRSSGDRWGMSLALDALSMMDAQEGDFAQSAEHAEQAIALLRELGTQEDLVQLWLRLAHAHSRLGRPDQAAAVLADAEREVERMGSSFGMAGVQFALATTARFHGDLVTARERLDLASARVAEILVAPQFRAILAGGYALLAAEEGDLALSRRRHTDAFEQALASGDYPVMGHILVGCADLSLREGNARLAAQLLGAAEAMNGSVDHSIPDRQRVVDAARNALGDTAFTTAYADGLAATIESLPALTGLPLALDA